MKNLTINEEKYFNPNPDNKCNFNILLMDTQPIPKQSDLSDDIYILPKNLNKCTI